MAQYFNDSGTTETNESKERLVDKGDSLAACQEALQSFRASVTKLKKAGEKIGTPEDNKSLRKSIDQIYNDTKKAIMKFGDELKKYRQGEGLSDSEIEKRKKHQIKLTGDFNGIKKDYEAVTKEVTEKLKMYVSNANKESGQEGKAGKKTAATTKGSASGAAAMEKHDDPESKANADQWKEFDEATIEANIIQQRQGDLDTISRMMSEVNQITQDIAVEVEGADAKLDQIGSNARSTKDNAKKALVDIAKGADYQKKSQSKM